MSELTCFSGANNITQYFMNNSDEFKIIYDAPNAHEVKIPEGKYLKNNDFIKVWENKLN